MGNWSAVQSSLPACPLQMPTYRQETGTTYLSPAPSSVYMNDLVGLLPSPHTPHQNALELSPFLQSYSLCSSYRGAVANPIQKGNRVTLDCNLQETQPITYRYEFPTPLLWEDCLHTQISLRGLKG